MAAKTLWQPTSTFIKQSNITAFAAFVEQKLKKQFTSYENLWAWSVSDIAQFWSLIAEFYKVKFHKPPTAILQGKEMPDYEWFPGATLNYAEHVFRNANSNNPALVYANENDAITEISWNELEIKVASFAGFLKSHGLKAGDSMVAYMPNIPEATIAFLAASSMGVIWSSCSPDFGEAAVIDRFAQIKPKILLTCDGYTYNGKPYAKLDIVKQICKSLPTVETTVLFPFLDINSRLENSIMWNKTLENSAALTFEALPFSHPLWVLFSSGTTGEPKAITHSHGGSLLEHLKYLGLQNDVKSGERFFWYSTTGWMMWNFVHASLLVGGTAVLYEGAAAYPNIERLWKFIEEAKINHFGTSAPFIIASMKWEITPKDKFELSRLRSIGSTGAPLPPAGFDWIYENVKTDVWLCSMSGGTDVCTAFVGGTPWKPVLEGEIQGRALGCDLHAVDEDGNNIINEVGEMVVKQPMPSMPIYFWNDEENKRYKSSYFEAFKGWWRHGDWVEITDNGGLVIYGRSDATLNRHGVRIGTAEIYRAVDTIKGIEDSIIMNFEMPNGDHYMPLFVRMKSGFTLDDDIKKSINQTLSTTYTRRHVPDEIYVVDDIPYTISGKKMEAPLKKYMMGMGEPNKGAMRNPDALKCFDEFELRLKGKF